MNSQLIEADVQKAVLDVAQAEPEMFKKQFKDRRFDAWEAMVDKEIRQYLRTAPPLPGCEVRPELLIDPE